jgi:hypothetical protein
MARDSGYKVTERILRDLGAVDLKVRRRPVDPSGGSVQLLIFDDKVPAEFEYPKSYTLSEGNMSTHDYSNLLKSQTPDAKSPAYVLLKFS